MKNKFLKTSFLILAQFLLIISCTKKESEEIIPQKEDSINHRKIKNNHYKEIFLAGHSNKKWMIDKYVLNNQDITNILFKECSLDNIQVFERSGEYVEFEGATKCDPSAPYIYDIGTWALSSDMSHLTVNSPHLQGINFEIIELKPNSLKVQYLDPNAGIIQIWLVPAKHASI